MGRTPGPHLQRKHIRGRVAGSLLTAVGMPEMAHGLAREYEQMALAWRAPERLTALRQKLEQDRDASALFDLRN